MTPPEFEKRVQELFRHRIAHVRYHETDDLNADGELYRIPGGPARRAGSIEGS